MEDFKNKIYTGTVKSVSGNTAIVTYRQFGDIKDEVFLCNAGSSSNKIDFSPNVGDNVLVAYDDNGDGFVLQSWFDSSRSKPFSNEKGIEYSNGKVNYYNPSSDKMVIDATNIELSSADTWAVRYAELLAVLTELQTAMTTHVHAAGLLEDSLTKPCTGSTGTAAYIFTQLPSTVQSTKIKIG